MANEDTFATRADPVLVTMPDGCRLAARVFGPEKAPPVLFVAGGDGRMLQWRGLVPELRVDDAERALFADAGGVGGETGVASLAADLRIAAFDARGAGWSSRSHGVCSTTGAAAGDALALAAALFGRRFHLVGHGLGAAVALQVALAGPRLVASLALISGTAGGDALVLPGQEFFEVRAALAEALAAPAGGKAGADDSGFAELVRRDVALGFTAAFVASHPELVDHLVGEALRQLGDDQELARHGAEGPTAADGRGDQFAALDLVDRLPEVTVPTLVIAGAGDAVLPRDNAEALAGRIPGARLVTLDSGHMVTVERAAEVAASLRAHVLLHP
jgi:pimeloyl-ACP methyl ester carboxylesterase